MQSLLVASPQDAELLIEELARTYPTKKFCLVGGERRFGIVEGSIDASLHTPLFAFLRQIVPNPTKLSAQSVREWGEACARQLVQAVAIDGGKVGGQENGQTVVPWRLHVYSLMSGQVNVKKSGAGVRRAALIHNAILEYLQKKARTVLRARVVDGVQPWLDEEGLAQVLLLTPDTGFFSWCSAEERRTMPHLVSRFPGGVVTCTEDPRPPSRAYKKLLEAEATLGQSIQAGQTCVDLGGAPGGWTFIAAERGARVLSIDRTPLREDLLAHPFVTFKNGDAFRYTPESRIDWLLCDVIAFPEKSIELLEQWLLNRWCKNFCVTIKFRGTGDYHHLEKVKEILRHSCQDYCLTKLPSNKNEVTACGVIHR